jgi:hypothetical protein
MTSLVANTMSVFLEITLWLNLAVCAIFGYNIGSGMNHSGLGVILGVLVGFLLNVLGGGCFILLMQIRDYVKEISERDYTATRNYESSTKSDASDTRKVNLDMNSLLR